MTAKVLAKLPKSQQLKAKCALQKIWMVENKAAADLAFYAFIESYALKCEKAADCLSKDRARAQRSWRRLERRNQLQKLLGVTFNDGI
ncbi:hypothetical protein ABIC01_009215 [Bradyrhizobium sp. RT4b]